jgi:hypothetical protein
VIRIVIRPGKPSALLYALRATRMKCTCGSADVLPEPGALGGVVVRFGFSRFRCRACHRHFWLRNTLAGSPPAASGGEADAITPGSPPPASEDASPELSALGGPGAPSTVANPPVDLRALDSYIERLRDGGV